jgi:hypothetical protein
MLLSYRRLKALVPSLNERPHGLDEFYQFVRADKIELTEKRFKKRGYYAISDGPNPISFIFLNTAQHIAKYLESAYHELTHHLVDYPCPFVKRKAESDAQMLTLIFLIPLNSLPRLVDDFYTLDAVYRDLVERRYKIYVRYGI